VTLGENYADVLDVVFDTNRATFLFFAPIAFFGIVFLISLIAATFEQVYKLQEKSITKTRYLDKMSTLAATFALWTVNCDRLLEYDWHILAGQSAAMTDDDQEATQEWKAKLIEARIPAAEV